LEKTVVLDRYGANPTALAPSAANVPVNGATPVARDVAEVELIVVFVKLSPDPPLAFTRFKILPLGALRLILTSPSQVWVILKLTLILATATAGKPAITKSLVTAVLSLIATLIAPEEAETGTAPCEEVMLNATDPPGQILAEGGETVGAPGPGGNKLRVASFDMPGNPPPEQVTTARYL
jgi:hypothetical protein